MDLYFKSFDYLLLKIYIKESGLHVSQINCPTQKVVVNFYKNAVVYSGKSCRVGNQS